MLQNEINHLNNQNGIMQDQLKNIEKSHAHLLSDLESSNKIANQKGVLEQQLSGT